MAQPDALIVGSGFAGAVCSRRLADAGRSVLVLEKRPQVAGNMFDSPDENGVLVHRYGPHIFHTESTRVVEFLRRFTVFSPYEHRVLGRVDGRLIPVPFNFTSLEALYPPEKAQRLETLLQSAYPGQSHVPVTELLQNPDAEIQDFGAFVFEKIFRHYTAKQWGVPAEQVDPSVLGRVPVALTRDDRYFANRYQMMPAEGYTALFRRMLASPLIRVELGCDAAGRLAFAPEGGVLFDGAPFEGPVVYTGPLDELLRYRFGPLPYRSLDLQFEQRPVTWFQPAAVVNYPNEEAFTRITEFKHMTGQNIEGTTTILREYPLPYRPGAEKGGVPYYPIAGKENTALYARYRDAVSRARNLYPCGRLAEYRYYNMDAAVGAALRLSDGLCGKGCSD